MELKDNPLTIQDRARRMIQKMEEEAALEPDGFFAAQIAMHQELEEAKSNLASGRDAKENDGCHG